MYVVLPRSGTTAGTVDICPELFIRTDDLPAMTSEESEVTAEQFAAGQLKFSN